VGSVDTLSCALFFLDDDVAGIGSDVAGHEPLRATTPESRVFAFVGKYVRAHLAVYSPLVPL
jgi:hypothetical protein